MAPLPEPSEEMAHLPRVIRTLVQRRRTVKDLIKRESDPVRGCAAVWHVGHGAVEPGPGAALQRMPPGQLSMCLALLLTPLPALPPSRPPGPLCFTSGAAPAAGDPAAGAQADRQLHVRLPGILQLALLRQGVA